jgi:phosphoglycerol transferase MdoB-like AlkP superfamily enzyme
MQSPSEYRSSIARQLYYNDVYSIICLIIFIMILIAPVVLLFKNGSIWPIMIELVIMFVIFANDDSYL